MMNNNRNFFLTIALSVAILTLWQVFYVSPRIESQREEARIEEQRAAEKQAAEPASGTPATGGGQIPGASGVPGQGGAAAPMGRDQALASSGRIRIDTPRVSGSINLTGGRLDDLKLKDYRVTVDKDSPNIELLNPSALPNGQYAELGYVGTAETGAVPGPDTVWTVEGEPVLTPSTPVTLTFTNERGLTFRRTIAVDQDYLFTVTDEIANAGTAPVSLQNYGRVTRFDRPQHASAWVIHEGLIGVTGEEGLQEISYDTIEDDKRSAPGKSTGGWLGITDKYWATVLIPPASQTFQPRFSWVEDDRPRYQSDFLTDAIEVPAAGSTTLETRIFAGAKEVDAVEAYQETLGVRLFDRLIDWGWFYYLTKPMFYLIDWLYKLLGNFGLAILGTTVIVKAIFFPLANKSYKSMANMKLVQPKLMELREKYADDRMKQQQAMMELYKTEKINPLAGCWPVLIQIPVFFALYKVLYVTIEMRHAPFFGWIQDLAAPDPTSLFNLFGLLPYDVPPFLMIGVWPLLMGITMFLQMRMNPTPPDPTQAMIFTWMPVIFTFMLATFPAGLVIYWAWNNVLSLLQQYAIMRKNNTEVHLWKNLGVEKWLAARRATDKK